MHKYDRDVNKESCKESACYFLIHILNMVICNVFIVGIY